MEEGSTIASTISRRNEEKTKTAAVAMMTITRCPGESIQRSNRYRILRRNWSHRVATPLEPLWFTTLLSSARFWYLRPPESTAAAARWSGRCPQMRTTVLATRTFCTTFHLAFAALASLPGLAAGTAAPAFSPFFLSSSWSSLRSAIFATIRTK